MNEWMRGLKRCDNCLYTSKENEKNERFKLPVVSSWMDQG